LHGFLDREFTFSGLSKEGFDGFRGFSAKGLDVDGLLDGGFTFSGFSDQGFKVFELSQQSILVLMAFWASQKCLWPDLAAFASKR
jgi:hypothetical protein